VDALGCTPTIDGGPDDGTTDGASDGGPADAHLDAQTDGETADGAEPDGAVGPALISLSPAEVVVDEGQTVALTVTLDDVAGPGGVLIALASDDATLVSVPSEVTVQSGETQATFNAEGVAPGFSGVAATLGTTTLRTLVHVAATTAMSGDLVITELSPLVSASGQLEWIEVFNDASVPLDIAGFRVIIDTQPNTIENADLQSGPVHLLPGERAFGVANPASPASIPAGAEFVYGGAGTASALPDTGGVVTIDDGSTALDAIDYTYIVSTPGATVAATAFPALMDRATQLDPNCLGSTANDDPLCWCVARTPTPGAANPSCAQFVLNEVLVDPTATDDGSEFVEIAGPPGADLSGCVVRWATADGVLDATPIVLQNGARLRLDGLYLIADARGGTALPGADLERILGMENDGGGIQLLFSDGTSADALGYGVLSVTTDTTDGLALVETALTDVVTVLEGASFSRDASSTDSNDNDADFALDTSPSPGAPNNP
jgi:hypothetical protein